MYQTLDDLANIQDAQAEPSKSKAWIKWLLIGLGLIILVFVVLFIYNGNNEENNPSSSYSLSGDDINSDSLDGNVDLEDGNVLSRLLQLESEKNDDKDIQSKNAEILSQLKDESFWNEKIEKTIDKEINKYHNTKGEVKLLGYGLLCKEYTEDLRNCEYYVGFSNKVDNYNGGGKTSYEVYGVNTSSHSVNGFSYDVVAKQIAMNDIGNGGVFYEIDKWHVAGEYRYDEDIIEKYLGKDFEAQYEGDYDFIKTVELVTDNDDGTSTFHVYIIGDETGEILFKKTENIISRKNVKDIIVKDAGISTSNFGYLYLDADKLVYKTNFSYNGHTYDYEIDAKDGTIIKGEDEKDIGDEKAMEIALKDSGLKATDLWRDVSHGHGEMKTLLMPEIDKEGIGENAIYNIEIETEDDTVYTYQIRATDGKILLKHLSEQFVIYDKEGSKKNTIYKIKSTHKKSRNLEIKPSELNMDDIYEFKDQIYLWISFDGDKIVDWSVIDRPYKHMGKMTKDELDEYYNFESHYPTKTIDKIFSSSTELKLSEFEENVLYKIKIGQICRLNIINDIEDDVIVYQGYYGEGGYDTTPYLKEGYAGSRDCISVRGNSDDYYSILYKKASSDDLFKVIDKKEITYLSKFKVGDELNMNQRYDEKYLYNDTNNDLTISVTDYGIVDAPKDFQFIVKQGKFAHCYEYTDVIKIIK